MYKKNWTWRGRTNPPASIKRAASLPWVKVKHVNSFYSIADHVDQAKHDFIMSDKAAYHRSNSILTKIQSSSDGYGMDIYFKYV